MFIKLKSMKSIKFLFILFMVILISAPICLSILPRIEAFSNLTPGNYPDSENSYLLSGYYPENKDGSLGVTSSSEMYNEYYKKFNKNSKYLANPNDGTCSRPEFCGPFYKDKKVVIPNQPPIIPFSSPDIRVNFYGSHPLVCPDDLSQ